MPSLRRKRGLLALLCLAVLLAAALAPLPSDSSDAILVPVDPLLATADSACFIRTEPGELPSVLTFSPPTPRAPPEA
jgi:hypothetical protein